MNETPEVKIPFKWRHPSEVMALHNLKKKKKALQARISSAPDSANTTQHVKSETNIFTNKRKNPFITNDNEKKLKTTETEESNDQTLFKLLCMRSSTSDAKENYTSFSNILNKIKESNSGTEIKVDEKWIPIDWTLRNKVRFLSDNPFLWNQKLKISEEASGITSFVRCLNTSTSEATSLNTSSNARFHQCSLYWQQPVLPWMTLFPRVSPRCTNKSQDFTVSSRIKEALHNAFTDSLRSLFQLIRTGQCPYFYACANAFTLLVRAAGIGGFAEIHGIITPTTRGFRQLLKQEDIEYTMPLKLNTKGELNNSSDSQLSQQEAPLNGDEELVIDNLLEDEEDEWFENMGVHMDDIKQIKYTQAKITHRSECRVDKSEESLILVMGHEVQALYNFLINCKSTVTNTGPFAGIPPTLLAPVAFAGGALQALKVRESKVQVDNDTYYSINLHGPILPHAIHNLCALHPKDRSMTATFSNVTTTLPLSKVRPPSSSQTSSGNGNICITEHDLAASTKDGALVFRQENLSDCGLSQSLLKHLCSENPDFLQHFECLKYTAENERYTWS